MGFVMAYYFATFVVILITHEAIFPVKGQYTVQGCENGDPFNSLVAEIQQLRVDLFDQLNKQVQSINDLNASFQELKSQHGTVMTSLQAVDRRSQEHENYTKQVQSIQEFLNESFQELKSLQVVDRRSLQEHDICLKQVQSIRELLNESVQQTKSQHDTVMNSLQEVDRRSEEQVQYIHEFLNESVQQTKSQYHAVMTNLQAVDRRRFQEHAIYIKQGQSIHELLNESFQEMKSQHGTVMTSLQSVDRRSQEHDICIKHVPSIHELLNESFQQIKSQYDSVNLSLQAVDQRLQTYQIDIMNQTQKSWKLVNDIWGAVYPVRDCSDIKARGYTVNGVYEVCVGYQPNRVCTNAFCNMETANGTSLVFQRRKDGSVDFNRTWTEYKQGFGNPNGEFWLGNEMLYLLTSKRNYKLRVDLEDFDGNKSFAEYTRFSIGSSAKNYRLTVGGYSGTASDSLSNSNGNQFSTEDVDNDGDERNCARQYGGAWWHGGGCSEAMLNGIYHQRFDTVNLARGIHWFYWHRSWYKSLKATEMKLVSVA